MTKAKLTYILLIASFFAYTLACFRIVGHHGIGLDGMSDGGGLL